MPTPTGWYLTVGCWEGNLEDFKNLIASDEGWPEARGVEVTRRRPSLQAVAALCEAHMRLHPKIIEELAEKWQETEGLGVDRGGSRHADSHRVSSTSGSAHADHSQS